MADIYGDIRPRQIDEFGNPVIPTGSLRDYATIGPPRGAYGTLGTGLVGSLAAAATATAVDNIPITASEPRPAGEEEEERKGGNKFEDSRWTENPAVTTTSPQAGDYRESAIEIKKGMNESMLMRTSQCHVNNPTITSV